MLPMMSSTWLFLILACANIQCALSANYVRDNLVDDMPKFMRNPVEVNKTIIEVEQLIAKNSDLPRLTRGEILSLLENITKEDELKSRKPSNENVMVVLPINTVAPPETETFLPTSSKHQIIETSSEFENLVTPQKSASKTTSASTSFSLTDFTSERSPLEFGLPMSIKQTNFNQHTTAPSVHNAHSSIPPDIAEVLKTLGVHKTESVSNIETARPTYKLPSVHELDPVVPSIDPFSYAHFKPIPTKVKSSQKDKEINSDMKDFLASFGLLPEEQGGRMEKSMKGLDKNNNKSKPQNKVIENIIIKDSNLQTNKSKLALLTNDMKKILQNMDLIHLKNDSTTGEYIFNPVVQTTILDQAKEVNKITKVLDGIRELSKDNNLDSLSQEEIRAHLDNITSQVLVNEDSNNSEEIVIESFQPQKTPGKHKDSLGFKDNKDPDPIVELNNSLLSDKNEFKRQQPSENVTSSTESSTTPEAETETTDVPETTTSELKILNFEGSVDSASLDEVTPIPDSNAEDSSPSLNDLAESFGGGETASEEPSLDALPSPRPNGLYFYVDWNTFLRVGAEDTKNRVNLTFAPKVGNPRLFLPVSVP